MRVLHYQRFASSRWLGTIVISLALVSFLFGSPQIFPSVHAAGLVYVNPETTPIQSVGSNFTVTVQVANIDPFNGWDIQIQSNSSVINATSLSIAGNIFVANYTGSQIFPLANCINGVGVKCTSSDVMGVVHSAVLAFGSPLPSGPTAGGLLFTITYHVVGSSTYSPIHILSEVIPDGANPPVSVQTEDGIYGVPPGQGFKLTASPNATSIRIGSPNATSTQKESRVNVTVTVSSFGGYSGVVYLTLKSSQSGLLLSLNVTSVSVLPSQASYVNLNVTSDPAYSKYNQTGTVRITVTGTSSGLPETTIVSINVLPPPDFVMGVSPSLLKIHATNSGSSIITLDTQSGFSGSIHLRMDVPPVPGLRASLGATDLTISPGQPAMTVFAVRTPPSDLPFVYLINITASSQSLTHNPFQIIVRSPSPDFGFQVGGSGFVVQAGQSRSFTLNMTSVDYFRGQLFFLASSFSGIKEAFTRSSVALTLGNSSTSLMTITTDAYLAPGNHDINVTVLGTTFLGVQVNHSQIITITVIEGPVSKTILGVQPPIYFGIVGVLWLGIIGAAVREIRRPKPKRFLS